MGYASSQEIGWVSVEEVSKVLAVKRVDGPCNTLNVLYVQTLPWGNKLVIE